MRKVLIRSAGIVYRVVGTRIFFLFDSEPIHNAFLTFGEILGRVPFASPLIRWLFRYVHPSLHTRVAGIDLEVPIGLAAGFDHEGQLVRIIDGLGFGFESMGTVTNGVYGGNAYPRLKRLVRSQALLVNKGFKSTGIDAVLSRLHGHSFTVPVGISLGRTNTNTHETHADAIADIIASGTKVRNANVPFAYVEINISCPNLSRDISFLEPERLRELLVAVAQIGFAVPVFLKMPIHITDKEAVALLAVVRDSCVNAIIFGNLQHDRTEKHFDADEIANMKDYRGHWGGVPCRERSDELVKLAYVHAQGAYEVIGCGGVFTAEDAYRKIRLGASAVQLASSTVFRGPLVASEISIGLVGLLMRDGFASIHDAVGVDAR